jgi:hypothetical protein
MPVRYRLSGDLLRITMEGRYSIQEILEAFESALRDPSFPKDARLLFDLRLSDETATRATDELRGLAESFAERSEKVGNRCAILASSAAQVGVSRMGAAFAGQCGVEVGVFTDLSDALSWLAAKTDKRVR